METKPFITTLSPKGETIIKEFESFSAKAYLDSASIPTIGWGTTHDEDGRPVTMHDQPITKARANGLFWFEARAKSYVITQALQKANVHLNQNQFDAVVSFSYNAGAGGFLGSTMFRLMKKDPNDPNITKAFMMWVKITVGGKKIVSRGLVNRRRKEAELYFTPC